MTSKQAEYALKRCHDVRDEVQAERNKNGIGRYEEYLSVQIMLDNGCCIETLQMPTINGDTLNYVPADCFDDGEGFIDVEHIVAIFNKEVVHEY